MKGKFIILEGIDGSGTTTQAEMIMDTLSDIGVKAYSTFEPTDGPIGTLLDRVLKGELDFEWDEKTLMLLYSADRSLHMHYMQELLDDGYWVICDRYKYSTYAYQGSTLKGKDLELMYEINDSFPEPDYSLFLDTPVDVCLERIGIRGEATEMYEKKDILDRVRNSYLKNREMTIIDGDRDAQTIHEEIMQIIGN